MEESKPTLAQLKEQPHYSYSALNTYINTCQLLYYYRYIEKAEAERTPLRFHLALRSTAFCQNRRRQPRLATSSPPSR